MIINNIKTAIRYFFNNIKYTLVNIGGLAMGFFCFILLNLYVISEKNYDQSFTNTYRLIQKANEDDKIREIATIGPRVGSASYEAFPEIEQVTKLMVLGRLTVGNDPQNRQYEQITTIDSAFFDIYNFKFIEGNAENAFKQANGIILTESLAKKYFGEEQALNKNLYTNIMNCVVAAVIEDIPKNTHFTADLLLPNQTAAANFNWWVNFNQTNWDNNASVTYFKIKPKSNLELLGSKITDLAEENWPEEADFNNEFMLQPVQDIHLYNREVEGEINQGKGNPFYVNIFFWIAIVVLLVACFNYTALLNVAYMNRTREIGVRKAVGASKFNLIGQFLTESILLTTISLFLAFIALILSKNFIVDLFGSAFSWTDLSGYTVFLVLLVGLLISVLSIAYPTYLSTRIKPVNALKEVKKITGFSLQKTILTFQFIASIVLIACTLLFYRQVDHLQNKDLGFDSEGIVTVDINSGTLRSQYKSIKAELNKIPEVENVSVVSRVPGEWKNFPIASVLGEKNRGQTPEKMIFLGVDEDFVDTYSLAISKGKNFTGLPADSTKVILNETAVKSLGLENPVGKYIEIPSVNWGGDDNALDTPFLAQVTAVVKDFYFEDFHKIIRPMVIGFNNNPIHNIDYYSIKINTNDWGRTFASLKKVNDAFDPDNPLEAYVLNEKFQRFYEADLLRSRLLIFFASIIIFISAMGLFTITAFVLKNRTKEIGIRKVLGATISDLVKLISQDFVLMVLIGSAIATPISYLIMNKWLEEFAYRLPINWGIFILASFFILLVAFTIVSLQTIRISLTNPTDSLRTE